MAQFRVGQRVRIVSCDNDMNRHLIGAETQIYGLAPFGYYLSILDCDGYHTAAEDRHLAPLTDPSADQFIARLKKLGSEPVNDAPKVTEREGK